MSESNPYSPPPDPLLARPVLTERNFLPDGNTVAGGRGWDWVVQGFALFAKQPVTWILITIVFIVTMLVSAMVPILGTIAYMVFAQCFLGGIMLGCQALDAGEELEVGHMFSGFDKHTRDLVVLGVLAAIGFVAITACGFFIAGGGSLLSLLRGGDTAALAGMGLSLLLGVLVILALSVPLYMAIWFAPALIVLHDMEPVEALKRSFNACLKNFVPFLVYGVVLMVLCVVAAIPFGLGFFVLGPVVIASIYTSYRDIFTV